MAPGQGYGRPTARRYPPEEKVAAVRMVRALRPELGTEHGTVQRVASQLGSGVGAHLGEAGTRRNIPWPSPIATGVQLIGAPGTGPSMISEYGINSGQISPGPLFDQVTRSD